MSSKAKIFQMSFLFANNHLYPSSHSKVVRSLLYSAVRLFTSLFFFLWGINLEPPAPDPDWFLFLWWLTASIMLNSHDEYTYDIIYTVLRPYIHTLRSTCPMGRDFDSRTWKILEVRPGWLTIDAVTLRWWISGFGRGKYHPGENYEVFVRAPTAPPHFTGQRCIASISYHAKKNSCMMLMMNIGNRLGDVNLLNSRFGSSDCK